MLCWRVRYFQVNPFSWLSPSTGTDMLPQLAYVLGNMQYEKLVLITSVTITEVRYLYLEVDETNLSREIVGPWLLLSPYLENAHWRSWAQLSGVFDLFLFFLFFFFLSLSCSHILSIKFCHLNFMLDFFAQLHMWSTCVCQSHLLVIFLHYLLCLQNVCRWLQALWEWRERVFSQSGSHSTCTQSKAQSKAPKPAY